MAKIMKAVRKVRPGAEVRASTVPEPPVAHPVPLGHNAAEMGHTPSLKSKIICVAMVPENVVDEWTGACDAGGGFSQVGCLDSDFDHQVTDEGNWSPISSLLWRSLQRSERTGLVCLAGHLGVGRCFGATAGSPMDVVSFKSKGG